MSSWRRSGWGVLVAALAYGGCVVGDGQLPQGEFDSRPEPTREEPTVGGEDGGLVDAGVFDAGTSTDAGLPDAGAPDGGATDAGSADGGGQAVVDAGTIELPTAAGWTFYGPEVGAPADVRGASLDQGGNLWVAGGQAGLFLLRSGSRRFEQFTTADGLTSYTDPGGAQHGFAVLSVAGGPAGVAYVGYEGLYGGADDADPPYMLKSGDADRVQLTGAGLNVRHVDISTPPGVSSHYPQGRDKIRSVLRIAYNPHNGDVWFGGNHGIALLDSKGKVWEHQHADINGYNAAGHYTLLTGDYYGLALDSAGDVWFGGGHRLGKLAYGQDQNFWSTLTKIDVWPDQIPEDAHPQQRTDDFVQDLAVSGSCIWVGSIPNSLAQVCPDGVRYLRAGLVDPKVTALETDPKDGSLWVGHIWGGLTRLKDGKLLQYNHSVLGMALTQGAIPDIQSVQQGGRRLIVVSFGRGAIGVYAGD